MIPPDVRFYGDTDIARTLWHEGIRRLTMLQKSMELNKLTQAFSKVTDEVTGHEIFCITQRTPWSDENFVSKVLIYYPPVHEATIRKEEVYEGIKPYILFSAGRYQNLKRTNNSDPLEYELSNFSDITYYLVWDILNSEVVFGPGTREELEQFGIEAMLTVWNGLKPENAPSNWPRNTNDATTALFKLKRTVSTQIDYLNAEQKAETNTQPQYSAGPSISRNIIRLGLHGVGHCVPDTNSINGDESWDSANLDISINGSRGEMRDTYYYTATYSRQAHLDNIIPYTLVNSSSSECGSAACQMIRSGNYLFDAYASDEMWSSWEITAIGEKNSINTEFHQQINTAGEVYVVYAENFDSDYIQGINESPACGSFAHDKNTDDYYENSYIESKTYKLKTPFGYMQEASKNDEYSNNWKVDGSHGCKPKNSANPVNWEWVEFSQPTLPKLIAKGYRTHDVILTFYISAYSNRVMRSYDGCGPSDRDQILEPIFPYDPPEIEVNAGVGQYINDAGSGIAEQSWPFGGENEDLANAIKDLLLARIGDETIEYDDVEARIFYQNIEKDKGVVGLGQSGLEAEDFDPYCQYCLDMATLQGNLTEI